MQTFFRFCSTPRNPNLGTALPLSPARWRPGFWHLNDPALSAPQARTHRYASMYERAAVKRRHLSLSLSHSLSLDVSQVLLAYALSMGVVRVVPRTMA